MIINYMNYSISEYIYMYEEGLMWFCVSLLI